MYKEYGWTQQGVESTNYIFPQILKFLESQKQKNKKIKILDVGCGNGEIANLLIDKGFNVFGIDASSEGVKIANAKNPNHFYVSVLGEDAGLPDKIKFTKFDIIICTEVIEHLYDPRMLIQFCKTNLENAGKLVITTPYHGYFKNILISLFGHWDAHFTALWDGGHIKFWSKSTLIKLLNEFNFSVKYFSGCGRIPFLWKSMIIVAQKNE